MDEMSSQPMEAAIPSRRPRLLLAAAGIVAVLVLAGGAFVGARLLAQDRIPARSGGGGQIVAQVKGGPGAAPRQVRIETIPAEELPQTEPAVDGVFSRRQDNSIFLGTGDIQVMVTKGDDGTGSKKASFNGPVIEVVVTHDTEVWQDDTEMLALEQPVSGDEVKVQQVVSQGSLDHLNENSTVVVWGERRGDRVIATSLVYRN